MTSSWCSSASDVSGIKLPTTGAALGNKAPEKMEGFALYVLHGHADP